MKKIIITVIFIATIILIISGQNINTLQKEQPISSHRPSRSLPVIDTQILPTENTAPASNDSTDIILVNAANPLPGNFRPVNLINLYNQRNKSFQLARTDIRICGNVFEAMNVMFAAAHRDGINGFIITSGYRTREEQQELYSKTRDETAAKPGESEHETGLAFDVTVRGKENFELTSQFEWLSKHCSEYGFILRYPNGCESITGYPYEPWHYRYVGTQHAKVIMDEGITLEEYLERQ